MREVFEREFFLFLNRIGPVGVDAEALGVGNDKQRWIFQRHRIELKLLIGEIEIGAIFLVFPPEMSALPDIGKARAPVGLRDTLFETVGLGIVCLVRRWLAQHAAEVDEMFLRRLALVAVRARPLVDELFGRHIASDSRDSVSLQLRRKGSWYCLWGMTVFLH